MSGSVPEHKFTTISEGGEFSSYEYGNWFESDGNRLTIAPRENQIELIIELAKVMRPPFIIRYVLLLATNEIEPGRYELEEAFTHKTLGNFLCRFRDFLENDGRHHIWVRSHASDATLVYDQHNVIYAYGPLGDFEKICVQRGMSEGHIEFPFPHAHAYQPRFDSDLVALLSEWTWIRSDLVEGVDDV